jgi:hypothetical protein
MGNMIQINPSAMYIGFQNWKVRLTEQKFVALGFGMKEVLGADDVDKDKDKRGVNQALSTYVPLVVGPCPGDLEIAEVDALKS